MPTFTNEIGEMNFPPIFEGDTFEDWVFTTSLSLTGARLKCYLQLPTASKPAYRFDNEGTSPNITIDSDTQFTFKQFDVALAPGVYNHDLVVVDAGGKETTYWTGTFTVLKKISK